MKVMAHRSKRGCHHRNNCMKVMAHRSKRGCHHRNRLKGAHNSRNQVKAHTSLTGSCHTSRLSLRHLCHRIRSYVLQLHKQVRGAERMQKQGWVEHGSFCTSYGLNFVCFARLLFLRGFYGSCVYS